MLAMEDMFERHTTERLKSEVLQVISRCDVSSEQVNSMATNNGAHMLKTVALLAEKSTGPVAARSDQSDLEEENVHAYSGALDGTTYLKELERNLVFCFFCFFHMRGFFFKECGVLLTRCSSLSMTSKNLQLLATSYRKPKKFLKK